MASKLVLLLVFVLDLIAFGLAVAAEQRRSTVSFELLTSPLSSLLCLFFKFFFLISHSLCCMILPRYVNLVP